MEILNLQENSEETIIEKTKVVLENGGMVIYPTETTYGIGVDPTNAEAVTKLLQYKKRREGMPVSIAVCDIEMAEEYVDLNSTARNIYKNFLPGPVTVISNSKDKVISLIESEKKTLGIRIPAYPILLKIIKSFGKPISATSANATYAKRPYNIQDILDNISERQKSLIDLVIDAGELPHNNPSSVVDTVTGEIKTLRIGEQRFSLQNSIVTDNVQKTMELGFNLGNHLKSQIENGLKKPTVIAIQGDLGAGKTHFASGVAKGLCINDIVKSPTFILLNEFDFKTSNGKAHQFFHIDTYRMDNENELISIGFEKMISEPNIILIEWADKVIPILDLFKEKMDFVWLKFEYFDENHRKISYEKDNLF